MCRTAWPRALRFLTTGLANEAFRLEAENVAMLAAGVARDELQVERVILRIQANQQAPHGATADFDLVRLVGGSEVGRDRWTLALQFTDRSRACRFVRTLLDRGVATDDDRAIFPGGARAVHITHKPINRALGIENVKHRRGAKHTSTPVLMRRLLSLDYLIERPTLGWLPTEVDKVQRFEALGIDRAVLPYRTYGEGATAQKRFFALKFPVAVDEQAATFAYVDPGLTTDSELRAWGVATRRSGPRSGRGCSPCTSSLSARAQRPRTAPRAC